MADRVIGMKDGRIVRDEAQADFWRGDLRDFKESSLGHAILSGNLPKDVDPLLVELRSNLAALLARV